MYRFFILDGADSMFLNRRVFSKNPWNFTEVHGLVESLRGISLDSAASEINKMVRW